MSRWVENFLYIVNVPFMQYAPVVTQIYSLSLSLSHIISLFLKFANTFSLSLSLYTISVSQYKHKISSPSRPLSFPHVPPHASCSFINPIKYENLIDYTAKTTQKSTQKAKHYTVSFIVVNISYIHFHNAASLSSQISIYRF